MSFKEKSVIDQYKIDKLTPEEVIEYTPSIVRIYKNCWITTYPNEKLGITDADLEAEFSDMASLVKEWQTEKLTGSDRAVWITQLSDTNEIVGFCVARKGDSSNELVYLYILPNHQGKHLGTLLMHKALEWMESNTPIELFGASYNILAIKFYEKFGFKLTNDSILPKFLHSGKSIPTMRMVKK